MRKKIWLAFLLFLLLGLVKPAAAITFSNFELREKFVIPCSILGTCPTPTPTTAPSPTPVPEPTATIIVITETPPTPAVEEMTDEETGEVLAVTSAPSPTVTPKVSPTVVTPTPTAAPAGMTTREMALAGGIVVILLLLVAQNWPKIKTWLHEKTQ